VFRKVKDHSGNRSDGLATSQHLWGVMGMSIEKLEAAVSDGCAPERTGIGVRRPPRRSRRSANGQVVDCNDRQALREINARTRRRVAILFALS
jgi:hypothetical protein